MFLPCVPSALSRDSYTCVASCASDGRRRNRHLRARTCGRTQLLRTRRQLCNLQDAVEWMRACKLQGDRPCKELTRSAHVALANVARLTLCASCAFNQWKLSAVAFGWCGWSGVCLCCWLLACGHGAGGRCRLCSSTTRRLLDEAGRSRGELPGDQRALLRGKRTWDRCSDTRDAHQHCMGSRGVGPLGRWGA